MRKKNWKLERGHGKWDMGNSKKSGKHKMSAAFFL